MTENLKKNKTENKKNSASKESEKKGSREEHGPLVEAAENIEAGAKVVGKKVSEVVSTIMDKTSKMAGPTYEKFKESIAEYADYGKDVVDEITQSAQDYIEKYQNKGEIKRINEAKEKLSIKLGSIVSDRYQSKKMSMEKIFQDEEFKKLIKDIENKNKEIVKLGKEMDKKINK